MAEYAMRFAERYRITILGGLAILGLMAFNGIHPVLAPAVPDRAHAEARALKADTLVTEARVALAEARRRAQAFRRTEDELTAETPSSVRIRQRLDEIAQRPLAPRMSETLRRARIGAADYEQAFVTIASARRASARQLDAMREAAQKLEGDLAPIGQGHAMVALLLMRRHERAFLARLEPSEARQVEAERPAFEATLARAPIDATVRTRLLERMARFQESFAALAAAKLAEQAAVGALSAADAALDPVLGELAAMIDHALDHAASRDDGMDPWLGASILGGIAAGRQESPKRLRGPANFSRRRRSNRPKGAEIRGFTARPGTCSYAHETDSGSAA